MSAQALTPHNVIKAFGLVFGDIGTSPIYTLSVIFLLTEPTEVNCIGILSLIIWTLILIVTVQYAWLAMSLSQRGEGGTVVLQAILTPLLKNARQAGLLGVLTYVGISLFIGDGVITPAMSILSAMEGIRLIPHLGEIEPQTVVFMSIGAAVFLFSIQKYGSGKIAAFFGPVMAVWFLALAFSGGLSFSQAPYVLEAINPWHAVNYMLHHGLAGFFILSEVILCATGGEALYADMGHLGRRPIAVAWSVVFVALVLCYMGQISYILRTPGARNILFEMVHSQAPLLYIPFLILSLTATIIASQSLISGVFSIIYQGMVTHSLPLLRVKYTSASLHSQIYINSVNWLLCCLVILVLYFFKESSKLAAAYGLAVTGSMTITAFVMFWIFSRQGKKLFQSMALFIFLLDCIFLAANILKIPHGGYWSILIALLPFCIILLYTKGQAKLYSRLSSMDAKQFFPEFSLRREKSRCIRGTAIFMLRDFERVSPYIVSTMFENGIIYEDNILLSIQRTFHPFGVQHSLKKSPASGIRLIEISAGYMEFIDLDAILGKMNVTERVIFYGTEEIMTKSLAWRIFAVIKKLSPSFVQFYKMPSYKVHGVAMRITM